MQIMQIELLKTKLFRTHTSISVILHTAIMYVSLADLSPPATKSNKIKNTTYNSIKTCNNTSRIKLYKISAG
jgi:hypothetical protein